MESIPQMGNSIYWIIIVTILIYIITLLGISKLASNYLLRGKYLELIIYIVFCAFLFMTTPNIVHSYYKADYEFFSKIVLLDNIADFAIYILCISGIIIPIFLREWIMSNSHLQELKTKQVASQVEQFKEQISPSSFFKILNKSKNLVKSDPNKASTMLMKLGQLLRYQLYDCNRSEVLLTAEIAFLRNFLELEKLYSSKFDYSIEIGENINGIFIYPSILLSYIQDVIDAFDNRTEQYHIDIQLAITNDIVCITLRASNIANDTLREELLKVRKRLDTLYQSSYQLTITPVLNTEVTKLILKLNRI